MRIEVAKTVGRPFGIDGNQKDAVAFSCRNPMVRAVATFMNRRSNLFLISHYGKGWNNDRNGIVVTFFL